eukprot:2411308-Pyramimonas_sp.AAC.1
MATKYYDHLDDVPFSFRQKADNPSSAIPVSERIATIGEKIAKGAEAPPQKESQALEGNSLSLIHISEPTRPEPI